MRLETILNWTLLLPLSTALSISSHLSTENTLQCSTIYSTSSPSSPLSTLTAALPQTTELSPVILHNYTAITVTYTPKPFETLFSVLATKTKTVEREAVNGTLGVEVTKFGTSTFWHHVTTTRTVVKERLLTSRTTVWIAAPTGFVGARDAVSQITQNSQSKLQTSAHVVRRGEQPQSSLSTPSSKKTVLQTPARGKFAVAVECEQHVRIHTTETLLFIASKTATVTAKQETVYTNRTIYGTITSTILANSRSSTSAPPTSGLEIGSSPSSITTVSGSGLGMSFSTASSSSSTFSSSSMTSATSKRQAASSSPAATSIPSPSTPSPSSSLLNEAQKIATNTTTITKTPYTITFTWTVTATTTSTRSLHATTTVTSYAACATGNLLGQTSGNKRINGVSLPEGFGVKDVGMQSTQMQTAGKCCEECLKTLGCLWGIWEASGENKGSCYLTLLVNNNDKQANGEERKEEAEEEGENEAEVCTKQDKKGTFGYSGKNGEVRYVISNGLCGMLVEA